MSSARPLATARRGQAVTLRFQREVADRHGSALAYQPFSAGVPSGEEAWHARARQVEDESGEHGSWSVAAWLALAEDDVGQ